MMEELPDGWGLTPLLSLCQLIRGVSFAKGEARSEAQPEFYPLLRATNINDELDLVDVQYVPSYRVNADQSLQKGDVVVAMSSGSKAVVGKGAQLKKEWNGTFGAFCSVLRPIKKIDSSYFGYFFKTYEYRHAISDSSAGTNINNLKRQHFEELNVPLPPLAEQRRIVAAVEALLAQVNTIRDRLNRVPTLLKRFRQAILATACDGRLTADWRENKQTDYTNIELPFGWEITNLDSIAAKITDGEHLSPKTVEAGVPLLSAKDVKSSGVDLSEAKYVTTADAEKFRNRCNPEQDDVLVVSRGATIGRISVVQTDCAFCLMGSVILIKPAEGTHKKYLAFALKSPDCQSQLVDLCGHSAQQAIYIRDIRKLSIKVPPLPEQKEIVRRVNALFALADQIDTKLTRAKARVDKLTQAILAKAFRGELVPTEAELARREGRQYESAEKLLERIQANSAASNGQPLRINSERKQKKNREPKGQPK